jgi:hypothetical protein
VHRNYKSIGAPHMTKKAEPMCNSYKRTRAFFYYINAFMCLYYINALVNLYYINAPMCFCNTTPMCFDKNNTKKTSIHPIFFGYIEHPLKPPWSIEEVVAKFFLKILSNFVTLKISTKTSTRRCYLCRVAWYIMWNPC